MNRKLISKAISDMDDSFIAESMSPPVANYGHTPERTTNMDHHKKTIHFRKITGLILAALGGLFIPMTAVARKYEYAPDSPRPAHVNRKDWIWICGCVIAVVIFVVILRNGVAPTGSGLQVGWVESNTRDHWSATYAFHDGYQQRTINSNGEPTVLEVEIVSSSGEIDMSVTDENGNIIYDQQGIETSSFEIEIPSKVTVKIIGEEHKGSFSLAW